MEFARDDIVNDKHLERGRVWENQYIWHSFICERMSLQGQWEALAW
jgi:hypothetical protein